MTKNTKIGKFLKESRIPGSTGSTAKKITVKLYGKGVFAKQENRPGSEKTSYYKRKAGQFIYSKLDFLNGAFGIIPEELDGYESTVDLPCFDFVSPEVSPEWFLQFVSRSDFYSYQGGLGNGGRKARRISPDDFLDLEIEIPPLPEQKKIAEILSGIDRAIAIYEQQTKVLANMLDALMQEEIAMNTSTKWIKVGDACTAQAGGTPDRSQKGYYEGRIPWVKSGEVRGEDIFQTDESISNEAISNSSAKIVPSGSVLVAMYGATAGQTARLRIDAATNQAVISLNSKTRELSNDYLYHSVTAFKNQLLLACQGSGQPNLSAGLIKELEIPLPDALVQQRISSALDSVRHRVLALRSKINSSKSLKSSIASDLLSGRKRVSV
jgi:type I restriction enzyme S subunit